MIFPCPLCAKHLSVPDTYAGKKTRCPDCGAVSTVPGEPAHLPLADRVTTEPAPPAPTQPRTATAWKDEVDAAAGPSCYLWVVEDDPVGLERVLSKRLRSYLETEQLEQQVQIVDDEPRLGPEDYLVALHTIDHDYGNRFLRYFLGVLSAAGLGACKLEVTAQVEDCEGNHKAVKAKNSGYMGMFGGDGDQLMHANVNMVANKIARALCRFVTGNKYLNRDAYGWAMTAFVLGLASLIPFLGLLLAPIGMIMGMRASHVIQQRELPRRGGLAKAGVILSLLGLVISGVCLALLILND